MRYHDFPPTGTATVNQRAVVGSNPAVNSTFSFSGATTTRSVTIPAANQVNGTTVTVSATWTDTVFTPQTSGSSSLTLTGCPAGPPSVTITTPPNGATYTINQQVPANYSCKAGVNATLQSCVGPVPNGSNIDTSTTGQHCFKVTATDTDGQKASQTNCYTVTAAPPSVTLTTPPSPPATYFQGETVPVSFSCTAGAGSTLQSCTSTAGPNGTPIDTSTTGQHCVTATAVDTDGQSTSVTHCYNVVSLTYTGRAYDASVGLLGLLQLVGPINDTGSIATTSTSFHDDNTVIPTSGLLNSFTLVSNVDTMPGTSTGEASVEATNGQPTTLNLGAGAPLLTVVAVDSKSSTSCNAGTLSSTGSTTIAYLAIGGNLVVGPPGSGAPIPAGSVAPNTSVLNVPGVASVTLNEQTPITNGLSVNAIDIAVLQNPALGILSPVLHVVVSHAESDLHGCSSVTG